MEQLAANEFIREEGARLQTLVGDDTAVIGIIGVAEMGPIATPVELTSWDDYLNIFGGHLDYSDLPNSVRGIYKQDRQARVVCSRTVHFDDITDLSSKTSAAASVDIDSVATVATQGSVTSSVAGPWNLSPGETLVIHCDEDGSGPDTATFNAVQAVRAGSGLSITDINTETLILKMAGGDEQTVTFTAAHAGDPDAAAAEINQQIVGGFAVVDTGEIDLYCDIYGTDSSVEIVGGTAITELGHTVGTTTEATSNVANIDAVTAAEAEAIIEAAVTHPVTGVAVTESSADKLVITSNGTAGSGSSVMVEASSTATAFGFDNDLHSGSDTGSVTTMTVTGKYDGEYAHDLRIVIGDATNGESTLFDFQVTDADGVEIETFRNCNMTADDPDSVEMQVNSTSIGSQKFTVEQIDTLRPANGTYTPADGDNGLTGLDNNDYIGDSAGGTGLHAFDITQNLTLISDGGRATSAFHQAMIEYCEIDRQGFVFPVLASPIGYTASQIVSYNETFRETSEFGAMFWPNIKIANPDKNIYGIDDEITVPVSPWVCGVISRSDRESLGGIYKQPAGFKRGTIIGAIGFDVDEVMDVNKRNLVYPKLINPISKEYGSKIFIDGVWVLKSTGDFPSIAERRGASYIERTGKNGLKLIVRHENNDEDLRALAHRTFYAFLKAQMKLGAFRTKDPDTAFYVDFGDSLNPESSIFARRLIGRIGLATQKSVEWTYLYFAQDTRALEAELGA